MRLSQQQMCLKRTWLIAQASPASLRLIIRVMWSLMALDISVYDCQTAHFTVRLTQIYLPQSYIQIDPRLPHTIASICAGEAPTSLFCLGISSGQGVSSTGRSETHMCSFTASLPDMSSQAVCCFNTVCAWRWSSAGTSQHGHVAMRAHGWHHVHMAGTIIPAAAALPPCAVFLAW